MPSLVAQSALPVDMSTFTTIPVVESKLASCSTFSQLVLRRLPSAPDHAPGCPQAPARLGRSRLGGSGRPYGA
eukprot:scaffold20778_cov69-Phaeocystis_antarctica.AAC.6